MNIGNDQNFDPLAKKFEKNIYGSTKGKLRHALLVSHLKPLVLNTRPLNILDVGGGTGIMTETLLKLGHTVTLTDVSAEALLIAKAKLEGFENVKLINTDLLSIDEQYPFDLVICHAVLEWLQHPLDAIEKLVSLVKPQGHLSLSFFNKDAQLFGNMLYGNFDYVEAGMQKKNVVRLSPNNPQKPKEVLAKLAELPVIIKNKAGIRCFHDYLKELEKADIHYDQLFRLELEYGVKDPYLWLGKYFMVIAQKE